MELQSVKQRFGIIGNTAALNHALGVAVRVAATDLTVLISGESGVGKEIFSQIIHNLSARKHGPSIAVNCGAIPEGTIDSELFGHEKGAFTGANDSRKGYFEHVNEGTIFLDEIGEMPLGTQSRLLRILESGEFIKVGSSKVLKTDVRVIAATNVDLFDAVKKGKFREDLYYRLNTVPIKVPPLRERKEDIPILFRKFCVDFAEKYNTTSVKLDEDALALLVKYRWPGNIRELKNIAEQISVLSTKKEINGNDLMEFLPTMNEGNLPMAINSNKEDNSGASFQQEREILYKLLFDMKNDLNELKKVVFGKDNKGDNTHLKEQQGAESDLNITSIDQKNKPVIIPNLENETDIETVDESLSIADKEKELIIKALDKHKGKRKYAALDLGISERTLYRKIKEYDINE